MTVNTDYYGISRNWRTFLEIYSKSKSNRSRQIHRQLVDQAAYDTWHLSFYLKEILSYKRLLKKNQIKFTDIPRKEKNLLVYLLMYSFTKKNLKLLELGHSLFELLDGLEVVRKFFKDNHDQKLTLDLTKHKYIGIDISPDLCLTSEIIHPLYQIQTFDSVKKAPKSFDLLYDRNVTSYAFTTPKDLADFINKSHVALMDLFVSKNKTFYSERLGKSLTYFSLPELVKYLNKPLYHLFGLRAPGPFRGRQLSRGRDVIEGFFLCSSSQFANSFYNTALSVNEIKNYFKEKDIKLRKC